jgi:hypothetical protein
MSSDAVQIDVDAYSDPPVSVITRPVASTAVWTPVDGSPPPRFATLYYLRELTKGVVLRAPLKVEVATNEDGLVESFAPVLRLSGVGETVDLAVSDLIDTVLGLWDEFSNTPTDKLHSSAVSSLARLRSVFGG